MSQTQCCSLRGETHGEVFAVHFVGDQVFLDGATSRILGPELTALASEFQRPEFLLDLGNVVGVSTEGLVILLKLRRQLLATGRQLVLCNPCPAVKDILEVTKLDHSFAVRREEILLQPSALLRPAA